MNLHHLIPCFLCALCAWTTAQAQQLRFQATPSEVFEGDAVTFHYRNDLATVTLDQIASWKWDFNDDGVWDVERSVGEIDPVSGQPATAQWITATWHATLDESLAVDGVQRVLPRLEVTTTGGQTHTQHGATENVVGPAGVPPDPDEEVTVKKRGAGNADMIVNFTPANSLTFPGVVSPVSA